MLAMFAERIAIARPVAAPGGTAEDAIRNAAVALVPAFKGLPGKIVAELIDEGQSEPEVLRSFFDQQIRARRVRLPPISSGARRTASYTRMPIPSC